MPGFDGKRRRLLAPLAALYGGGVRLRNAAYDRGWLKTHRVGTRVLSIGNLSAGGSGKTPATAFIATELQAEGWRVAILSRGYGRSRRGTLLISCGDGPLVSAAEGGDEPVQLALQTRNIAILVDGDRVRGARELVREFRPDVILLDDGFQHRRLHRDVDIVLVPESEWADPAALLPVGAGREPVSALERADFVVRVRYAASPGGGDTGQEGSGASLVALQHPAAIFDPATGTRAALETVRGQRFVAVCGIARPERFRAALTELQAIVLHTDVRRDHYRYRPRDVAGLVRRVRTEPGALVLTTMKDWVKLRDLPGASEVPFRVLELGFSFPVAPVLAALGRVGDSRAQVRPE